MLETLPLFVIAEQQQQQLTLAVQEAASGGTAAASAVEISGGGQHDELFIPGLSRPLRRKPTAPEAKPSWDPDPRVDAIIRGLGRRVMKHIVVFSDEHVMFTSGDNDRFNVVPDVMGKHRILRAREEVDASTVGTIVGGDAVVELWVDKNTRERACARAMKVHSFFVSLLIAHHMEGEIREQVTALMVMSYSFLCDMAEGADPTDIRRIVVRSHAALPAVVKWLKEVILPEYSILEFSKKKLRKKEPPPDPATVTSETVS